MFSALIRIGPFTITLGLERENEEVAEEQAETVSVGSSGDGVAETTEGQTFGYVGTMSPVTWDDKL